MGQAGKLGVQKRVFYEGIKMYNSLRVRIKRCDRLRTFKRELKEYILNTIRYNTFNYNYFNRFYILYI